jgi:Spy/CpxP family protein refolding chaperone
MKYLRLFPFLLIILVVASVPGSAQDAPAGDASADQRAEDRPNLFAELGLTREQVQQIRRINQDRRPRMMEAQHRLRLATQGLDASIYRDSVSEEEFRTKLKELQSAQAEVARLRFESELSIRRILTPDQLVRFRELRQKFAEEMRDDPRFRRNRRGRGGLPRFRPMAPRPTPKND